MDFLISRNGTYYLSDSVTARRGFTVSEVNTGVGNGRGMDVADFNHDGHLDFVRAVVSSGQITLFSETATALLPVPVLWLIRAATPMVSLQQTSTMTGILTSSRSRVPADRRISTPETGTEPLRQELRCLSIDINNHGSYGNYDFNRDGNQDLVTSSYTSRRVLLLSGQRRRHIRIPGRH